jgi:hypothetical protein
MLFRVQRCQMEKQFHDEIEAEIKIDNREVDDPVKF